MSSFNAFSNGFELKINTPNILNSAHHKITGSVYLQRTPAVMVSRLDDPFRNPLRRSDSLRRLRESDGKNHL